MVNVDEEIKRIEEEIRKTQYNKATEHHIGKLKAKLAKLRQMKESQRGGGGHQIGVKKSGNGMVSLVGFPSVGKSTLFNALTNLKSETGDFDFTTVDVIPGMMNYRGANIQILDLPGIIEGAEKGKGMGKKVLSIARTSDVIMVVTDIHNPDPSPVIRMLHSIGIRLNRRRPNIFLVKKDRGGINIYSTVKIEIDEETIKDIMREFKIVNGDLVIREKINIDDLIDFLIGNRVYIPAIFVLNKIDENPEILNSDEIKNLVEKYNMIPVSAKFNQNIDTLKDTIYDTLDLITIYVKPPDGEKEPMVIKRYSTVEMVCRNIHKDFVDKFKYAIVNGPSSKYPNQRVGLDHVLEDGDTVTLFARYS
ncbi:MAG: OBG GTPase family GTP-binding protein [Thermoplasmata archaeon]